MLNIVGIVLVILSLFATLLTVSSSVGIIFSLGVLILSGIMSAITGRLKYSIIIMLIITMSIVYVYLINGLPSAAFHLIKISSLPFIITLLLISKGCFYKN